MLTMSDNRFSVNDSKCKFILRYVHSQNECIVKINNMANQGMKNSGLTASLALLITVKQKKLEILKEFCALTM